MDAGEGVGEPGLGIDVVELCGLDEGVDGDGPVAAGIGAAEGPIPASDGNRRVILPISAMRSRSSTVGIRFTDNGFGVTS